MPRRLSGASEDPALDNTPLSPRSSPGTARAASADPGLAGEQQHHGLGRRARLARGHAAAFGVRAGQPVSFSNWAASETSSASESGGPTSWAATGKPSAAKPAGTDTAG